MNSKGEHRCFNCGADDHWASECPLITDEQQAQLHMIEDLDLNEDGEEQSHFQRGEAVSMHQRDEKDVVYLDSCTTRSTFVGEKHLTNVQDMGRGLTVRCNAGQLKTSRRGDFGGLKVWAMEDGIANVLSLGEIIKKYRVTFDSLDGYFAVHTPGGEVRFVLDEHGMSALNLCEDEQAAKLLIQTVRGNYEGYTPRKVKQARVAREAKAMMGNPSEATLKDAVSSGAVDNLPIDRTDVSNSARMFGPALQDLRGKTTRRKPERVEESKVVVPRAVAQRLKYLTLAADVFFVDKIPFLITMSRQLQFVTAEFTPSRTAARLAEHLKKVLRVYRRAGYVVRYIFMDGEFEKIKPLMPTVICNTTAASEHVTDVERKIRVVKERTRGTMATLPFKHVPRRMKIELVYFGVFWLNAFPTKSGVSRQFSPRELVPRLKADYAKHCRVLFGSYCEVHDEPSPSNSMKPRTHPAIALGPSGNLQGTVKFYSLNTGLVLRRRKFNLIPMPDAIKARVNEIGLKEKQNRDLVFADRTKQTFDWSDEVPIDDPGFQGLLEQDSPFPDIPAKLPGIPNQDDGSNGP